MSGDNRIHCNESNLGRDDMCCVWGKIFLTVRSKCSSHTPYFGILVFHLRIGGDHSGKYYIHACKSVHPQLWNDDLMDFCVMKRRKSEVLTYSNIICVLRWRGSTCQIFLLAFATVIFRNTSIVGIEELLVYVFE